MRQQASICNKFNIFIDISVLDRESIIYRSQHPESLPRIQELESMQMVSPVKSEAAFEQPIFITHLNNLELKEGEPAHFECRVEPYRDPNLKIEFQLNGKPLPAGIFAFYLFL